MPITHHTHLVIFNRAGFSCGILDPTYGWTQLNPLHILLAWSTVVWPPHFTKISTWRGKSPRKYNWLCLWTQTSELWHKHFCLHVLLKMLTAHLSRYRRPPISTRAAHEAENKPNERLFSRTTGSAWSRLVGYQGPHRASQPGPGYGTAQPSQGNGTQTFTIWQKSFIFQTFLKVEPVNYRFLFVSVKTVFKNPAKIE